jgi:hypothetical protein
MTLYAYPLTLKEANAFVDQYHRHNDPTIGHRFSVGAIDGVDLWGVAILGRTVARTLHSETTAEITRVAVREGAPCGTCSFLYNTLWKAWRNLGGTKCITYTLQKESGASLRGLKDAGWKLVADIPPRTNKVNWQNRPGRKKQEVTEEAKYRWEIRT